MVIAKRLLSFLLMLCLTITSIVPVYADTEVSSGGGFTSWRPGPTNPGYSPTNSTFEEYGYRVTITTAEPIAEENVPSLGETFSISDLDKQFEEISAINDTRYWEPGNYGLNFISGSAGRGYRVLSSVTSGEFLNRPAIQMSGSPANTRTENPLAWMVWETPDGWNRTQGVPDYNEAVASYFVGEKSKLAADPGTWLSQLRQAYNDAGGRNPKEVVKELMGNGQGVEISFPYFSWATNDPVSAAGDPYQRVMWSRMGHIAMCIQFAWAALEIGDTLTYTEMCNAIAGWVSSDYASQNMPILMVEATSGVNTDGNIKGAVDFCTLPLTVKNGFGNNAAAEQLYIPWPEEARGNMDAMLSQLSTKYTLDGWGNFSLRQGAGGHPEKGTWIPASGKYAARSYFKHVGPRSGKNLYGYFVNWTYWTDELPPPPSTDKEDAMGSFTWKLTPNGMHDKTPEKEVNESSTIYDLNISQNGYNANNYDKWNSVVRADGIDCNKLRIRIYHISENLAEEQPATKYARDAVKQKGADVTTPINKVTISPTGNITGFPAGTITTPFSTPF